MRTSFTARRSQERTAERNALNYRLFILNLAEQRDELIEAVKGSLSFERVRAFLPFLTTIKLGNTHRHLVNQGVWPIVTETRVVHEGETLCRRRGALYPMHLYPADPCPGCLAIAQGLAARELFPQSF
jgi:hypothetical protein